MTPLENQFSISGIDSMNSRSGQGTTRITLQFRLDRNIDAAFLDVHAAISAAARQLPKDMPTPPSIRKSNPAEEGIYYLSVSSETLPLSEVESICGELACRKIYRRSTALHRPRFLASRSRPCVFRSIPIAVRGIGIDEVSTAIRNANVNLATGQLDGDTRSAVIHAEGQLSRAAEFRDQIISYRDNAPVRFVDVANVIDSVENPKLFGSYNGVLSVTLEIHRQPGANTIAVVDAIKDVLPGLVAQLPPSIKVQTYLDRSNSIRNSINDVQFTLFLAAVLVIGVIFIFLRTLSATFIPSIALPISIVGTFAGMAAMGYSLDNLSLMALTLCVGFVVDDAIVMKTSCGTSRRANRRIKRPLLARRRSPLQFRR